MSYKDPPPGPLQEGGSPGTSTILEPHHAVVGRRLRKVDGLKKATGEAVYTDDIKLPRMLHGKILRSTVAHARIRSIDTRAAAALPGVAAVITGKDLPNAYGVIVWTPDETALCTDKVRYIGNAVAAVAAVDERTAEQACRLIEVDYEPLPTLLSVEDSLAHPEVKIHESSKHGNISKHVDLEFGAVDAEWSAAPIQVEDSFYYEGSTHTPIEPHCAIGHYDSDGNLTVWSATQIPHYVHRWLSRVLELPDHRIRVIQPFLGGAFGGKSDPFDLEFCSAKLSVVTGRPVKILYTREEVFYSHRGRHPMQMRFRLSADREGHLKSVDSKILIDGGAYSSFGLVTAYYAGQLLTGPYRFPTYRFEATRVFTNKPCNGPKRGHGSVQPRFAFEVALDMVAERVGIDPIEIRRRNFIGEQTKTVNGQRITSNGFLQCLDSVERASGWKERRGKLGMGKGLGVAGSMYISGTNYPIYPNEMPQSGVQVKLDRSGKVTLFSGASDIGQGSNSVVAYLIAEELGCEPAAVNCIVSDTDLTPVDLGAYSSRVTFMIGNATIMAGRELRAKINTAVAEKWACSPDQVQARLGTVFHAADPSRNLSFAEAVQITEAKFGTLGSTGWYKTPKLGGDYRGGTIGASPAYSFTAHVAEVSVDVETGIWRCERLWAAHDCGKALNPTLVEGQIEGSAYMGWAEAAMEEQTYDHRGLHKGPSLLDYRIPTSMDVPDMKALIVESHDPEGPWGAKEAGEGPLHPAIPAIANAIFDAVGIRVKELPFHAARILKLIRQKAQRGVAV